MAKPIRRVDKVWIRQRLADRDLTQTKISTLLQIDRSGVTHLLNGRRAPTTPELVTFAEQLDGEITPPQAAQDRHTAKPGALPATVAAVRLNTPGRPENGWTLFYEPGKRVDVQAVGRLAVCQMANGRRRIGFLAGAARGKWDVTSPWNGAVAAAVSLDWGTPVLQIVCV